MCGRFCVTVCCETAFSVHRQWALKMYHLLVIEIYVFILLKISLVMLLLKPPPLHFNHIHWVIFGRIPWHICSSNPVGTVNDLYYDVHYPDN